MLAQELSCLGTEVLKVSTGTGEPEAEVKQLAHRGERVVLADCLGAMHGLITQVFEALRLGENRRADCLPEAGLVDERAQVVLIGQCEGAVVLVDSRHGQLRP